MNQKTAWKLGHAIPELMDDRDEITGRLTGVVEVDEAIVGGKPKFRFGVKSNRGRGTGQASRAGGRGAKRSRPGDPDPQREEKDQRSRTPVCQPQDRGAH
jgi:hypothetical protein